jgi:hypothetical protein
MDLTRLKRATGDAFRRKEDAAGLSRRDVLAGIGLASVFAVAGSALLTPSQSKASPVNSPPAEPEPASATTADAAKTAEAGVGHHAADLPEFTEFSAQRRWRRRRWRWRRRWVWRRRRVWRW